MPVHDWTRVDAGIFHDFHQDWIYHLKAVLNAELLPEGFYALEEQHGSGVVADVLTLRTPEPAPAPVRPVETPDATAGGLLVAEPRVRVKAETDLEYYARKQSVVAVRHITGDQLVAVIEVVSRGNKSGSEAIDQFVKKSCQLLSRNIHLLILDLQPPTARDPQGVHGRIWNALSEEPYQAPPDKPLTLADYRAAEGVRAFVEPVAVGDVLIDMPLYLTREGYVAIPLEATYNAAYRAVPKRWRDVIGPEAG